MKRSRMATIKQVKAALASEEPRYSELRELDSEALAYVCRLVTRADPLTTSKAVYLASMIPDPRCERVLFGATSNPEVVVRVAVAAAARNLRPDARDSILLTLLDDADYGVRKVALNSLRDEVSQELRAKLDHLSRDDVASGMRRLAARVLRRFKESERVSLRANT